MSENTVEGTALTGNMICDLCVDNPKPMHRYCTDCSKALCEEHFGVRAPTDQFQVTSLFYFMFPTRIVIIKKRSVTDPMEWTNLKKVIFEPFLRVVGPIHSFFVCHTNENSIVTCTKLAGTPTNCLTIRGLR